MTRKITKCPQGHEVVTSKKKEIQCARCYGMGIYRRFDSGKRR